jgi:hypothetical protein
MEKKFIQVRTKRTIPDMDSVLLFFIKENEKTPTLYNKELAIQETKIEADLIKFLQKMNIHASTKSDRYSLPVEFEIRQTNYGEAFLNATFSTANLYRKIAKALLDVNAYKIRFYVFMEIEDKGKERKVNYYFRYYVH